jgi:hypothetical protein
VVLVLLIPALGRPRHRRAPAGGERQLRTRLLVVGTYRDTDLDRRHPLAEALPLVREVEPAVWPRGLPVEVHALLEEVSGQAVPHEFALLLRARPTAFFLRGCCCTRRVGCPALRTAPGWRHVWST